jgi:hypothetical protein
VFFWFGVGEFVKVLWNFIGLFWLVLGTILVIFWRDYVLSHYSGDLYGFFWEKT